MGGKTTKQIKDLAKRVDEKGTDPRDLARSARGWGTAVKLSASTDKASDKDR